MGDLHYCQRAPSLTRPRPEGNQLRTIAGKRRSMTRHSPRTLVLMALALLAAGWFWWRMTPRPPPRSVQKLRLIVLEDGGVP